MDVGAPSNFERLMDLFGDHGTFRASASSHSVDDYRIRRTIREVWEEQGYVICPHTACGEYVRREFYGDVGTIVVATAHPAKFSDIVEPIIGEQIAIPADLYAMIRGESRFVPIGTDYHELFVNGL